MIENSELFLKITDAVVSRMIDIIKNRKNLNLKLRVYIIGGGCGGFQYKFSLEETVQEDDWYTERDGVMLIVDPVSLQYLSGGIIDYYEGLEGSRFVVINPNAVNTCSCGLSFSV